MANKHFSLGEFRANQSSIEKLNENRIFKTFFQSVLFHECLLFLKYISYDLMWFIMKSEFQKLAWRINLLKDKEG